MGGPVVLACQVHVHYYAAKGYKGTSTCDVQYVVCYCHCTFGLPQELNNPILFLDVMGWCWQPDFRNRPSASVLGKVLANPSFSRLVDVAPLSSTCQVTASCICTLPLAIVAQEDDTDNKPLYVANADLQVRVLLVL